ncbi:MAG: helix-turn-helix transcriptional regulator [Selenomonadaceae bacterium]|nr:helix-turn-helix transcriptional regulator [Selenomonadaceae bacterium]
MTNEEFANKIVDMPLPVIATGLLKLESERGSTLGKTSKNIEPSDNERREQFGARVRIMRQLLGLTQTDLAKKMGLTSPAITAYEKGKRDPSLKNLLQLSKIFNVTSDWLIGNEQSLMSQ